MIKIIITFQLIKIIINKIHIKLYIVQFILKRHIHNFNILDLHLNYKLKFKIIRKLKLSWFKFWKIVNKKDFSAMIFLLYVLKTKLILELEIDFSISSKMKILIFSHILCLLRSLKVINRKQKKDLKILWLLILR